MDTLRIKDLTIFGKHGVFEEEKEMILDCIRKHRKKQDSTPFNEIFYKADKLSRICFRCPAYDICYWSEEKKNHKITY